MNEHRYYGSDALCETKAFLQLKKFLAWMHTYCPAVFKEQIALTQARSHRIGLSSHSLIRGGTCKPGPGSAISVSGGFRLCVGGAGEWKCGKYLPDWPWISLTGCLESVQTWTWSPAVYTGKPSQAGPGEGLEAHVCLQSSLPHAVPRKPQHRPTRWTDRSGFINIQALTMLCIDVCIVRSLMCLTWQ